MRRAGSGALQVHVVVRQRGPRRDRYRSGPSSLNPKYLVDGVGV